MTTSLQFLGAAGTVTGSKYRLEHGEKTYLIDCGLFQGPRELEQLNWEGVPLDADKLDAICLTHAHIDHTGYLPRLVQMGYRGPVHASAPSCSLLELLLPDSGHLQEEQARYANKKGHSRYTPAYPLYTQEQAVRALKTHLPTLLETVRLRPSGV